MLKRLKNLVRNLRRLSESDLTEVVGDASFYVTKQGFDALSGSGLRYGPTAINPPQAKGEFLPDMTDEEVLEYERAERLGWKNFKLPWQKP